MGDKEFNRKRVIIILIIFIIAIVVIGILTTSRKSRDNEISVQSEVQNQESTYYQKLEDGTKINNSTELNKEKNYKGLKITNIQLTEKNGMSVLLANVENTSGKDINDFTDIDIIFYDTSKK